MPYRYRRQAQAFTNTSLTCLYWQDLFANDIVCMAWYWGHVYVVCSVTRMMNFKTLTRQYIQGKAQVFHCNVLVGKKVYKG